MQPAGLCTVRSRDTFAKLSSLQQLEVLNGDAESMINLVYGVALPPSITTDYTAIFHVKSLDVSVPQSLHFYSNVPRLLRITGYCPEIRYKVNSIFQDKVCFTRYHIEYSEIGSI